MKRRSAALLLLVGVSALSACGSSVQDLSTGQAAPAQGQSQPSFYLPGFLSDQTDGPSLKDFKVEGDVNRYTMTATDAVRTTVIEVTADPSHASGAKPSSIGFHAAEVAGTAQVSSTGASWKDPVASVSISVKGLASQPVVETIAEGIIPVPEAALASVLSSKDGTVDPKSATGSVEGLDRSLEGSLLSGSIRIDVVGVTPKTVLTPGIGRSSMFWLGQSSDDPNKIFVVAAPDATGVTSESSNAEVSMVYDQLLGNLVSVATTDGQPVRYQIAIPGEKTFSQTFDPKQVEGS
jgi:hypothetical protein